MQQAALATLGDAFFYALARRVAGLSTARVWIVLHALSLYWTYTCARPLSNSTEAALNSIALYYWPLTAYDVVHGSTASLVLALVAAYTGILVRPTGLLIWAFLGGKALCDGAYAGGPRSVARLVGVATLVGYVAFLHRIGAGMLGYAADSWYFQRRVFTPAHFFVENVMRSLSVFYGAHPWHWYLTQGLPGVLTVSLPWALRGWEKVLGMPRTSALWTLGTLALWTVGVFSLLSHKEARFLQPLVPHLHLFAAYALRPRGTTWRAAWSALPTVLRYALLVQVPVLVYVLGFHAQGQIRVMQYVHNVATPRTTFGFLMPCHSTPWQSHMHARVLETTELDSGLVSGDVGRAWFLACPPPRHADPATYWDQSDFFLYDPVRYLRERFPSRVDPTFPTMRAAHFRSPRGTNTSDVVAQHASSDLGWRHPWPSHLVVYESLLHTGAPQTVGDLLAQRGYEEVARFWNTVWHPEPHRKGDIVVLRYIDEREKILANYTKASQTVSPPLA